MPDTITDCSFCSKHKDTVEKLIVGYNVAICSECIDFCSKLLVDKKTVKKKSSSTEIPDPKDICEYLDQYVVGQTSAKIVLSVAITNHYKRINNLDNKISKSNILMFGPTGTGKTIMAKTVAEYLDVPFVVADATTLTEAGYVGDDVDTLIERLYQKSGNDVERTQRGIIFLDEIDKISRKGESSTVSRDVSGEGVQQALLKLVEGTVVKISSGTGRKSDATIDIDTSNILFIAGGAFIGLDKIAKKSGQGSNIGFAVNLIDQTTADLSKITPDDLVKYGLIPEFVGRFPSLISLNELTKAQLIQILTKVKHNLIEQYQWLFDQDGIALDFELESLDLIAENTLKNKTGARGLHSELERILLPHMYDLPRYRKQSILTVAINPTLVNTPTTLLRQENE